MIKPISDTLESDRMASHLWRTELDEHRRTTESTLNSAEQAFCSAITILETSVRRDGKILLFGNGGSAADAQHIAAELVVRYRAPRVPIAAVSLTTDTSTLTACGNDLGYDLIFSRQIEAIGRKGDVAFAISTSGRSPNILKALGVAKNMGLYTVGLAGGIGGAMGELCDSLILVPCSVTSRVQEMHITIGHMLCMALEQRLGLV